MVKAPPSPPPQQDQPSRAPAALALGPYELLRKISTGGMGEVFVAARKGAPAGAPPDVAVKLLLPHLSQHPEFVQMFLDEARTVARMAHPNVLSILDLGEDQGRLYLAMPLVEGVSLSQLLKSCLRHRVQVPLPLLRLLAERLCAALHYAHELTGTDGGSLEIVHRDVSPSNVLLSVDGSVFLMDFGVAKSRDNIYRTMAGLARGKLKYMAPEQLGGSGPVDRRADVYAAAATLYEAATLVPAFRARVEPGAPPADWLKTPEDPWRLRPELGASWAQGLLRALRRSPQERFATAAAFAEALGEGEGETASPADLSAFVRRLCPEALAVVNPASAPEAAGTQTAAPVPSSSDGDPAATLLHLEPAPDPSETSAPEVNAVEYLLGAGEDPGEDHGTMATRPLRGARAAAASAHAARAPAKPEPSQESTVHWPAAQAARLPRPAARVAMLEIRSGAPRRSEVLPFAGWLLVSAAVLASGVWLSSRLFAVGEGLEPAPAASPASAEAPPPPPPSEPPVTRSRSKAAKKPAAPARVPQLGYLSVDVEPWAEFEVAGRTGFTPISRVALPAGEHEMILRNPDLGREERHMVRIRPGALTRIRVDLR